MGIRKDICSIEIEYTDSERKKTNENLPLVTNSPSGLREHGRGRVRDFRASRQVFI